MFKADSIEPVLSVSLTNNHLPLIGIDDGSHGKGLPSHGISYPKGYSVGYYPYTFSDMRRNSESTGRTLPIYIEESLPGIKCSFPSIDLTFNDFLFINMLRRISCLGDRRFEVAYQCNKCFTPNSLSVTIGAEDDYESEVDLSSPQDEENDFEVLKFDDIEAESCPLNVEFDNLGVISFSPMTIGKFLELAKEGYEKDTLALLASQIISMPFSDAYNAVKKSYSTDYLLFQQVEQAFFHGVSPIFRKCPVCSVVNKIRIEGGSVVLMPFRRPAVSLKDRIRPSNKEASSTSAPV